ncbi:YolD-like family protein [Virgibacillus ndiopensis]|uniref:YolD-like family protein n=1 Tax=Virgibacillus ndiopensis TaxID=2004408 RepID=UPI000C0814D1|nr:YolD-like family protein [Virgibacillus ndiopensis]
MNPNKLTPGHNLMWESSRMMLPEHKSRIREHQKELKKRTKPIFDEQQIILFSQLISEAVQQERNVKIQIFHPYHDYHITGRIQKTTPKQIKLVSPHDSTWISFDDIMGITIL